MRRLALLLLLLLVAAPVAAAQAQVPDTEPPLEEPWPEETVEEALDPLALEEPLDLDEPFDPFEDEDWEPEPAIELVTSATVPGRVAMLRTDGKAAIPRGAPKRVRAIVRAANQIAGKPYKWGGGHAKLVDRGYDCSGAVGYALIRSGLQTAPMASGQYARWGSAGAGRWVTIYANKGHVYMEVAGLRLDTSAAGYGEKGVRWRPVTGKRRGFKARHISGL